MIGTAGGDGGGYFFDRPKLALAGGIRVEANHTKER